MSKARLSFSEIRAHVFRISYVKKGTVFMALHADHHNQKKLQTTILLSRGDGSNKKACVPILAVKFLLQRRNQKELNGDYVLIHRILKESYLRIQLSSCSGFF
ncbi:hypothetical protein M9H77_21213 [Catharanthus roseus]|uniref:Uncharacterized protein n=1 Tax=Catharanthus roseus TaxID=4058 RepID=A0ACC0ANF1_CATRO|nr:hypothetical protein M9H77_21213 [Catharanthus roseus]